MDSTSQTPGPSTAASGLHVAIVAQYYWPEDVGPAIYLGELAEDLVAAGHRVSMVTAFPNYPEGKIHDGYRGRHFLRESRNGVEIVRNWIYARPNGSLRTKALTYASFCVSALVGLFRIDRPDVIFALLPPLPLGVSTGLFARWKDVPLVINIQDIYPDIAIKLGYLKSSSSIGLFRRMERWVYRAASEIIVIADGFRENLLAKGVNDAKLTVIGNWVDSEEIKPAPKDNEFRRSVASKEEFLVVYSGNISRNTDLLPVLDAAEKLKAEPFRFLFIGEGAKKPELQQAAAARNLSNVTFLGFQPLERYAEALAASDVQLASLHAAASNESLPSKVLKSFAAGRPVLALAEQESELSRLLQRYNCGITVDVNRGASLVDALRDLASDRVRLERLGANARQCLVERFDRRICIASTESVLLRAATKAAMGIGHS